MEPLLNAVHLTMSAGYARTTSAQKRYWLLRSLSRTSVSDSENPTEKRPGIGPRSVERMFRKDKTNTGPSRVASKPPRHADAKLMLHSDWSNLEAAYAGVSTGNFTHASGR